MKLTGRLGLFLLLCFSARTIGAQEKSREALATLFEQLKSTDLDVRNRASQGLHSYLQGWIGQDPATMQKAVPAIMAALDDSHPDVRVQASAFFGLVGLFRQKDGLEILRNVVRDVIQRFEDPHPNVRGNLMRAIAGLEPAPPYQAVGPFMKHLKDPDGHVRGVALYGLVRAAPASLAAADAVARLLDSTTDPESRRGLIQMLGSAKPTHPVIIAKLVEQLDYDNRLLREDTIRALGEIGPPAAPAIQKLRVIASDPSTDQELRAQAEAALRSIEKKPPPRRAP